MPRPAASIPPPPATSFAPLILGIVGVYVAREFLIPVALALLITFLLTPVVRRLQKRGVPKVPAVLMVVLPLIALTAGVGIVIAGQVMDLAYKLPRYKSNIEAKIGSLRGNLDGPLARAAAILVELSESIDSGPMAHERRAGEPAARDASGVAPTGAAPREALPAPGSARNPLVVKMVSGSGALEVIQSVGGTLLAPLGTAAMVLVFVIFMLIESADLRDRFLRLLGQNRLSATTQGLDEAAKRVSRHLATQAIINVGFGAAIGLGLWAIGISNAPLWALLAAILRYIPYAGTWVAAGMPITISMAASVGWQQPLLALGVFLLAELITNNFIEPRFSGARIGISPLAVMITTAFWMWLWGGVGLVLATPLTLCFLVLSRYVPRLEFLDVMLGQETGLSPAARTYQRLLALDTIEAGEVLEESRDATSLIRAFDEVAMPALALAEADRHRDIVDQERLDGIYESLLELVEDIDDRPLAVSMPARPIVIACLPARDRADEIAGHILAQALRIEPVRVEVLHADLTVGQMVEEVQKLGADAVCISALPPYAAMRARYVYKRLHATLPELKIMLGIWGVEEDSKTYRSLAPFGTNRIASSFQRALELLDAWLPMHVVDEIPR